MNNLKYIPVFDPVNGKHIGNYTRTYVHTSGMWHKGIQAHVIRPIIQGDFEIFMQQRSNLVDIGKWKYDQSLATQMIVEDYLDEQKTLKRGLFEELNINKYECIRVPLIIYIKKRYNNQVEIYNNEIITLFLVYTAQEPNIESCNKIKNGSWIKWNDFVKKINLERDNFTKTAQAYMLNPGVFQLINDLSKQFLNFRQNVNLQRKHLYIFNFNIDGSFGFQKFHKKSKLDKYLIK